MQRRETLSFQTQSPLGTDAVLEYSCQVPTAGTLKVKFKILVDDRAKFRRICLFHWQRLHVLVFVKIRCI
jgi:hypothetical protein